MAKNNISYLKKKWIEKTTRKRLIATKTKSISKAFNAKIKNNNLVKTNNKKNGNDLNKAKNKKNNLIQLTATTNWVGLKKYDFISVKNKSNCNKTNNNLVKTNNDNNLCWSNNN